jgi:hypothetical protein
VVASANVTAAEPQLSVAVTITGGSEAPHGSVTWTDSDGTVVLIVSRDGLRAVASFPQASTAR